MTKSWFFFYLWKHQLAVYIDNVLFTRCDVAADILQADDLQLHDQ
ncbi:hypothetical protein KGM_210677 [Danaus plexippus plexippus]|uniref:Uncharacterized protein n=1 Tax=Danaus plexippus plexippus TaxID=278856 RepID=A0A212F0X2_DANPL|nr:hypothetical protein KGM_210677 [Danaus plexippus plexippus]